MQAGWGSAWPGLTRQVNAGMVRPVEEWRVQARLGLADRVRIGKLWSGWIGEALLGLAGQDMVI